MAGYGKKGKINKKGYTKKAKKKTAKKKK